MKKLQISPTRKRAVNLTLNEDLVSQAVKSRPILSTNQRPIFSTLSGCCG
jgi:hypothetical protein